MKASFTAFLQPCGCKPIKRLCIRNIWIFLLIVSICSAKAALIAPPFITKPFQTDTFGISAGNERGFFHRGPQQNLRYFLGQGGQLILDFPSRFTDGPGPDFAILTSSESWGTSLTNNVLFEFYLTNVLVGSMSAPIGPDQFLQFELPGNGMTATRVVIINTNSSAITLDDAGVSYSAALPQPGFGLEWVNGTLTSEVNTDHSVVSVDQIRNTSAQVGFSRATAYYTLQSTADIFKFGFNSELRYANGAIDVGNFGLFTFRLSVPARYDLSATNGWFGTTSEAASDNVVLSRILDTGEKDVVYAEYDRVIGEQGNIALEGRSDGGNALAIKGARSGLLDPGVYELLYNFMIADEFYEPVHHDDNQMDGFFLFTLSPSDHIPSPPPTLSDGIEYPGAQTGGAKPWFRTIQHSHDNVDSARSGPIGDNEQSWLRISATGPGSLSFWWRVSSQPDADFLTVSLDGRELSRISGVLDAEQKTIFIPAGSHEIEWTYRKDASGAYNYDAAWVDEVSLTSLTNASRNAQTIDFPGPDPFQVFDQPIALSASASSSLPVSFTVVDGPGLIQGNQLIPLGTGIVTVRVAQPGNDLFAPAPTVERQVTFDANAPYPLAANTPEMSVGTGGPNYNIVAAVAPEPNGRVIVGGRFSLVSGKHRQNIARFNVDGTLDNAWQPEITGPDVLALAVLDEYVFVGGNFSAVNGLPRSGLARISLNDGSVDRSFDPAPNGLIWTLTRIGNDLLVGGAFERIGGVPRNFVAKLLTSGQVDPVWNPSPDGVVTAIAIAETNVYLAGSFTRIGPVSAPSLAKVSPIGTGSADPGWKSGIDALGTQKIVANKSHVFAAGYYRTSDSSSFGVAALSAHDGKTEWTGFPNLNVASLTLHGDSLYIGSWLDARFGKPVEKVFLSNLERDNAWNPSVLSHSDNGLVTRIREMQFRGEDLFVAGDFLSFAGSPGSGIALIPSLEGSPFITPAVTSRNMLSGAGLQIIPDILDQIETTHFQVTQIENGQLFKADMTPLLDGSFVSKDEAAQGLRFLPNPDFTGIGTFKAQASETESGNGLGGGLATGVVTVATERLSQTIKVPLMPAVLLSAGSVKLHFTASSGLPVTYKISGPATLTAPDTLNLLSTGVVSVIGTQPGNELYLPAVSVGTSFEVKRGTQTITFDGVGTVQAGTPITLHATASSGLPVAFNLVSGSAIIAFGNAQFPRKGVSVIRASQSGNENYFAADPVEQAVTAIGIPQSVSFPQITPKPFNAGPVTLTAAASSGLPIGYTVLSGPGRIEQASLVATSPGTVLVQALQPGTDLYDAGRATQEILFTRGKQEIVFDPVPSLSLTNRLIVLSARSTSGLPITFWTDSNVASVSNSFLTVLRPGSVTIYAQQAGSPDYEPSPVTFQSFDVPKLSQTVSFQLPKEVALDVQNISLAATASSGLPVHYSVSGPAEFSATGLLLKGIGPVQIEMDQPGSELYNPSGKITWTIQITRGWQSIRFEPITNSLAGSTIALHATASSGLPVLFGIASGPATLISSNLVRLEAAGPVQIVARQEGDTNYFAAPEVIQSITVVSLFPQTISLTLPSQLALDASPLTLTAAASSGLPVAFNLLSGPARLDQNNVLTLISTGIVTVVARQSGNAQYAAAEVQQTLRIVRIPQNLTFTILRDIRLSEGPVLLEAATSSGLPVEFALLSGPATVLTNVLTLAGVGRVIIEARQPGNDRFEPAFSIQQSFSVLRGAQTISFPNLNPVRFQSEPVELTATASSGLPIQFGVVSGPGILSGRKLTIVAAGELVLVAMQPGDENYEPAVPVEQTVRIEKALQSISFEPPSEIFLNDGPITLSATVDSLLSVRFVVLSGPALLANGILTPIGVGTVVIQAQQLGDANHEPAAPIDRTIRIVAPQVVLRVSATANSLKLAWPAAYAQFKVEECGVLGIGWTTRAEDPTKFGDELILEIPVSLSSKFYRLRLD